MASFILWRSNKNGKVPSGSEIIYLGWIMAGGIKGYKEAAKLYKVCAVCGIGMISNSDSLVLHLGRQGKI